MKIMKDYKEKYVFCTIYYVHCCCIIKNTKNVQYKSRLNVSLEPQVNLSSISLKHGSVPPPQTWKEYENHIEKTKRRNFHYETMIPHETHHATHVKHYKCCYCRTASSQMFCQKKTFVEIFTPAHWPHSSKEQNVCCCLCFIQEKQMWCSSPFLLLLLVLAVIWKSKHIKNLNHYQNKNMWNVWNPAQWVDVKRWQEVQQGGD